MTELTIRTATSADAVALCELATLDSAPPLDGPALVAESGGRLVAAISLADGRAVADPFRPSRTAVELLRLRAARAAEAQRERAGSARRLRMARRLRRRTLRPRFIA